MGTKIQIFSFFMLFGDQYNKIIGEIYVRQ